MAHLQQEIGSSGKIEFTVNAALLEELGERLVGRPEIALAELIKNSYDADAFTCRVTFSEDRIEINDNGHGMSFEEFEDYWMRIGTTHKLDKRVSRELGRPLTGSKGLGRLSAQFLARSLVLETACNDNPNQLLYAIVDWGAIERGEDIASVEVAWELRLRENIFPHGSSTGMRITLQNLKDEWTETQLRMVGAELWMLRSPFRRRQARSTGKDAKNFDIEIHSATIEDAQAAFDEPLNSLFNNWRARISGTLKAGRKRRTGSINVEFKAGYPRDMEAERFQQTIRLPIRKEDDGEDCFVDSVSFEIFVFKLQGRQSGGITVHDLRDYLEKFGNVSIYDAGFRLPYYGMDNDWLEIAQDQARRLSVSELLPRSLHAPRYMLDLPEPRRLFGAVEIDTSHERRIADSLGARPGTYLVLQPGRDRLQDNKAYRQLKDLIRFAIDFYANRYRARELRRVERMRDVERATEKQKRALAVLEDHRGAIPASVYNEVRREVASALETSVAEEAALDKRAALLAPLASAGMVALSLSHELAREHRFLGEAVIRLRRISAKSELPELNELAEGFGEIQARLASLQELFAPLLSEEDKEPKERLRVKPVVDHVVRALGTLMPRVGFDTRDIPRDLRFPVGAFAEWSAVLQNALTNAWNAMLDSSQARVRISGGQGGRKTERILVSDTGKGLGMPLEEGEELFEPFQRRLEIHPDRTSIAIGGQGLGLTIVRMIARRRGAEVAFVEPDEGYSTTLELSWKG